MRRPADLRRYLSRHRYFAPALLWPLAGILLWLALDAFMASRLQDEKAEAMAAATEQAATRSRSYAAQLLRTIQQIDQLTLSLKLDWEASGAQLDLEQQQERGLYPRSAMLYASIIDRHGDSVSSTLAAFGDASFAGDEFFHYHRTHPDNGLTINKPVKGKRINRQVVRFSRRIDADGEFDGVALVSVEPAYLTTFHDERSLRDGDFISVQLPDGTLLANTEDHAAVRRSYVEAPSFGPTEGTVLEPASKFFDREARIVAWKKLSEYPLVSMAAISETNALAGWQRVAESYRNIMSMATLGIAAFSLTGMLLTARLSWRRQREEVVRQIFRTATEAAQEGFYTMRPLYGRDGKIVDFVYEDCNEHGAALLGTDVRSLRGKRLSQTLDESYRKEIFDLYLHAMETGYYEDEFRVPKISPLRASWVNRRYVRAGDGLAVTLRDISKSKEHELALSRVANTDALTSLPNRHWLGAFLPDALERAARQHRTLAVMFIDLDNFKNINDSLGHEAGDMLLKAAARRLREVVRAADHVVRLGGDEFTIVLEGPHGTEDVARVARQVVRTISAPYELGGVAGQHVNASIGISMFPADGADGDTLLRHADIAMYAAKAAGKGRFEFYQPHLSDSLFLRLAKEHALREAIDKDQFVVHYQPRVSTRAGRLNSLEALVRWHHPERGMIGPDDFIGLAEDTGLIVRLGELVIDNVCAQLAEWGRRGLGPVPVSVNVSGIQLREGGLSAFIAAALARHRIDPRLLEVELTESSVIDKGRATAHELSALRELGIKLSVDDFGTGYSSLAQLQQLDVDVLKVDRAFTSAVGKSEEGAVLFRAIVSMADALDISVVAEGVETREQLHALQSLDCDEVQGYLVSKALPAHEVPSLIARRYLFPASATA
ncbi:hypothetical protein NCCP691_01420 [Noviherbaspirillum aridicola]|uniref:Diguanylate cyclase (GGDEF)-like protein n=1 Tax=Noviherbaspirillum aridicola TaxID=2849687 RepID=A0ABQ4PZ48_9BURK|nr:hypothetical protein NCCP691_01420 [Noviherbaspirillum aridicola]